MPERLPIGADVVEAATYAHDEVLGITVVATARDIAHSRRSGVSSSRYFAMKAAIREALDKLGLREERRQVSADGPPTWEVRIASDWRSVDVASYETGLGQMDVVSASDRVDAEPAVLSDRHLMEIVFGPATREQADEWTIEVQRLLDERFPAMSAAVGVRYGIDSRVDSEPSEGDPR